MNTQKRPRRSPSRRAAGVLATLVTTAGLTVLPLASASATTSAEPDATIGDIAVTPTSGLPEEGAVVTVTGTGFDTTAGIYVAVCVDNGPGVKPSPCIGGVDTTGAGGATWISDTPPSYAEGLTQPYGPGGSFALDLPVPMVDPVTGTDCRVVTCAVTTRYDHLRGEDRGADNLVPLTFGGESGTTVPDETAPATTPAEAPDPTGATTDTTVDPAATTVDDPTGADGGSAAEPSDGGTVTPLAVAAGTVVVLLAATLLVTSRRRAAARSLAAERPSAHDDS
ncbi:hypothetical protein [Sanguibacter sp. 25GB23B1]|uniref:hypothetical protein n=1 Tax=unclassified Sanguibacter TaxID=2645534 RepID=UPI0032AFC429